MNDQPKLSPTSPASGAVENQEIEAASPETLSGDSGDASTNAAARSEAARLMGRSQSQAKGEAARLNGRKGGRPRGGRTDPATRERMRESQRLRRQSEKESSSVNPAAPETSS